MSIGVLQSIVIFVYRIFDNRVIDVLIIDCGVAILHSTLPCLLHDDFQGLDHGRLFLSCLCVLFKVVIRVIILIVVFRLIFGLFVFSNEVIHFYLLSLLIILTVSTPFLSRLVPYLNMTNIIRGRLVSCDVREALSSKCSSQSIWIGLISTVTLLGRQIEWI